MGTATVRLRRFLVRIIPGAIAVGVLAGDASAVHGQSAGGQGSIEIIGVASTAPIANAIQQLSLMVPSGYVGNGGPGVANAVLRGALSLTSTGDTDLVASVVQTSDVILDISARPAGGDSWTKQRGTGKRLFLAQFN